LKVVMKRFLTYDFAEVYPGPYMNLVIGANGTGKSTIVCAICLGLGGSPNLLGRSKSTVEFIKHGHTSAHIEIHVKGVDG
ncbi:hypothetical protein ROZALSC1DRAFT_3966, partial [Rozella allomycis CSF55]